MPDYCEQHKEVRDLTITTNTTLGLLREDLKTYNENITEILRLIQENSTNMHELDINGSSVSRQNKIEIERCNEQINELSNKIALLTNNNEWKFKILTYCAGILSGILIGIVLLFAEGIIR